MGPYSFRLVCEGGGDWQYCIYPCRSLDTGQDYSLWRQMCLDRKGQAVSGTQPINGADRMRKIIIEERYIERNEKICEKGLWVYVLSQC